MERSYNTKPLTFQEVKELLRLETDLKKELIEFEKTFTHPHADTYELKDIKSAAKRYEKYFKEQMGLDKRRTHEPSFRMGFLVAAGGKPVTGDFKLDNEIKHFLQLLPSERPEVIYSIHRVYSSIMQGAELETLNKLCTPLMKKVLDEEEKWDSWDVFPNLPVGKVWMEWDRIAYTEEKIDLLNKRIKGYYEGVYVKSLASLGQPLGRTNSMLAIAQIVAKEIYNESLRDQENAASYLNQLKSEAYSVVQEQKLYDQNQINPIMELHYAYGILHD